MSGHLTPNDIKKIVQLIDKWSEPKLSWDLLVEACKTKLNIACTRQTLNAKPAVKIAFKDRKEALKHTTSKAGYIKDIKRANEKIEELTQANEQLRKVNDLLLQRFTVWQANADMYGVSQAKLDQPVSSLK